MTIATMNTTAAVASAPYEFPGSMEPTDLVRGSVQRLLEHLRPLVRQQRVVLNLASVGRIDAAGISALVSLYSTAREAGHSFAVSNASPRVAQILTLVGLDRILVSHNAVQNSDYDSRMQRPAA
jgi:anti-anti-sigma factor